MLSGKQIDESEKHHPLKGKRRVDLFQSGANRFVRAETLSLVEVGRLYRDGTLKWMEDGANGVESQTNFEPLTPHVSSPIKRVSKYN